MNNRELSAILQDTCPVLPGQENRAWLRLQDKLARPLRTSEGWWKPFLASGFAVAALLLLIVRLATPVTPALSASSQSPGVFATAFYSEPAHAQVVWLNGMDPASDGPTYMDRSGQVDDHSTESDDSL